MKKTLIIAAFFAAVLAVSCQNKEVPEQPAEGGRTFKCVIAQPDTRLGITDAGKTSWEAGDKIMIHGGKDGADRLEITLAASDISSDGKTATFSIGDMEPYNREDAGVVSEYYAQYPADLVPAGNLYYECCFHGTDAPLMAACNVEDTFTFYNLCGIISYTVSGPFDKVVFTGNNKETVAFDYYQVRVRDDGSGPKVNYHKPGNSFKEYTEIKAIEKDVVADGQTVNYLYLPKGVDFSSGFTFKFYDGEDLVKIAATQTPVNVDHNKILALGDISSHLEDYEEPTGSDHTSSITDAVDLSAAAGPANCYMVTVAGAYKFPVVKGNDPEEVPGSVFDVEILWETYNNAEEVAENSVIAKVDFDGPTNYVFFETPSSLKPGNAVIAAKDAQGKIIWSWHIWIPKTAVGSDSYNGLFGNAAMTRNLGALVDVEPGNVVIESVGFYYQWGRKDPFPAASAFESSTPAATSKALGAKTGDPLSIAQSIANPTVWAFNGETGVDPTWKGANWCTSDLDFWGTATKSMYDPCPPGWRVPVRDSSLPIIASDASEWSNDADGHWYSVSGAYFPAGGYMDDCGGSITHAYDRNDMWLGTKNSEETAYCIDFRIKNGAAQFNRATTQKARGATVRCVAE